MPEIENRRSIRKFDGREVPNDLLEQIVMAGQLAPSAKNRQPWKLIVTSGNAKREALSAMKRGLECEKREPFLPESAANLADAEHTLTVTERAPAVIFVVNTLGAELTRPLTVDERVFEICNAQSIGAAMQNMSLTAVELGLGSLWICNTFFAQRELNEWLNTDGELFAALAVGYPAETPPPRTRKPAYETAEWRK
ncbi:MAG: nitroreductase family protein [Lachnospiraceae bacterium]|nr:nitroreductase family protein [Ruminococcus sp.]MCM1275108.1 nitroreductase family protein [Lachnospiraceae bacterium]